MDVLEELQLTFRRSTAYITASAALRRLAPSQTLTEGDYEVIADRLNAQASFRLAVEALEEWRRAFPESTHAEEIDAAIIDNLYSLRANDEARAHIGAFLERDPDGPRAVTARITLFRLDVREGRTTDVKARGLALWEDASRSHPTSGRERPASWQSTVLSANRRTRSRFMDAARPAPQRTDGRPVAEAVGPCAPDDHRGHTDPGGARNEPAWYFGATVIIRSRTPKALAPATRGWRQLDCTYSCHEACGAS